MIEMAPLWNYVAVVEVQPESGQFHIHAGIRGRYDVSVMRQAWHDALNDVWGRDRSLTSGEDSPGNVDISWKPGAGGSKSRAAGKIAGYIAKYVSKDTDSVEFNRKGYFCRRNNIVPKAFSYFYAPREKLVDSLEEFIAEFHLEKALNGGGSSFTVLDQGCNRLFLRVPRRLFNPPPF